MVKQLTAIGLHGEMSLKLTGEKGALTGLTATAEVNYGEVGLQETVELLPGLTQVEQATLQGLYARLLTLAKRKLLEE